MHKYDVVTIGGKEQLIKPTVENDSDVLCYVSVDELFSRHILSVGHDGRNRIMAVYIYIKKYYLCNI